MRRSANGGPAPLAVVMGDINVVHALARAGIASACLSEPSTPVRFSRHVRATLPWSDPWDDTDAVVRTLCAFAAGQPEAPVVLPQTDAALLLVSRHRETLARGGCRFALADTETVERLVDKARFMDLAREAGLPVPRSCVLGRDAGDDDAIDLRLPVIVKPLVRTPLWERLEPSGKALRIDTPDALAVLRREVRELGLDALAQEVVAGPESSIESYHAYVDASGATLGEFTGRKIRTLPREYGFSTSVETTAAIDVRDLGREVVRRLALHGVSKADFKRAPDGSLHLLEVNPRFNLWHAAGAIAGVNLPALAYADVTGRPGPAPATARPGVRWCQPLQDLRAAREHGIGPVAWLRFVAGCEARSTLSLSDPRPFLVGRLGAPLRRSLAGDR